MKSKFITIETTYPNSPKGKKLAKNLAEIVLNQKLAACVQFTKIESAYFWKGKLQNDVEILLKIKIKNSLFLKVEKIIKKHHSYEIPQIISTQINQGSEEYFQWFDSVIKNNPAKSK